MWQGGVHVNSISVSGTLSGERSCPGMLAGIVFAIWILCKSWGTFKG